MIVRIRRTGIRHALGILAVATAVGCGGESSTGTVTLASIAGTYALRSINGSSLPYVNYDQGGSKDEIISENLTLTSGGSWTHSYSERITLNGQVMVQTGQTAGTYTLSGSTLAFTSTTNESFTGSIAESTLTLARQGRTLVYVR